MAGAASGPWRPIRRHGVGLETALDTLRRWPGFRFMALADTLTTAVGGRTRMSTLGYKRKSSRLKLRSALPPNADVTDGSHQSLLLTHSRSR